MQRFHGSLAHYRLPLVVPALFQSGDAQGVLKVRRGPVQREFFLAGGKLVAESSNDPREHLAQALVDARVLEARAAVAAFERAKSQGMVLGAFLVKAGVVPVPLLREVLTQKARDGYCDCYGWESGELEWQPGAGAPHGLELTLKLALLHEDAVALWKEWRGFRELFPNPSTHFRVKPGCEAECNPEELAFIQWAEAGATMQELIGAHAHAIAAARVLMHLHRRGVLVPRDHKEDAARELALLVETARRLIAEGQYERAATLAAKALESSPVPEAQALYEEAEEKLRELVAEELKTFGAELDVQPLEGPTPEPLTSADLFLHAQLTHAARVTDVLGNPSDWDLQAYQSFKRLMQAGLLKPRGPFTPGLH